MYCRKHEMHINGLLKLEITRALCSTLVQRTRTILSRNKLDIMAKPDPGSAAGTLPVGLSLVAVSVLWVARRGYRWPRCRRTRRSKPDRHSGRPDHAEALSDDFRSRMLSIMYHSSRGRRGGPSIAMPGWMACGLIFGCIGSEDIPASTTILMLSCFIV